ncbi:MAG: GSCFA domain-containing protein [Methylocystaceae bacterium]|nr:MAG: GSCFA domain-containing protein [Methylocystaceae bacterium]
MASHPYSDLPDFAYWRRAVTNVAPGELDPVVEPPFRFGARDKVATAGSCFAQHIGRYLEANGCNYLVTEPAHPMIGPEAKRILNYGLFTARYGNIYTSRQLLQLMERAYGRLVPQENVWTRGEAQIVDPFRPNIQPGGYNCERELHFDRERHFAAVRDAFESLDIFVFTLGLTEAWRSRADGVVFPLCPGVAGGQFSAKTHEFVNLGVDDVVDDMTMFVAQLRRVNPRARVILTVSPVPLVATAEPRHVLVSTIYSKSVLRVACEQLTRLFEDVAYFPSYEIIAGGFASKNYFAADGRSVTEDGVAHVMRVFAKHFLKSNPASEALRRAVRAFTPGKAAEDDSSAEAVARAMRLMCDEEALDIEPTRRDEEPTPQEEPAAPESGEAPTSATEE